MLISKGAANDWFIPLSTEYFTSFRLLSEISNFNKIPGWTNELFEGEVKLIKGTVESIVNM